jgi:glycosyltransferase involved in cell wall biosynthesis
LRITIFTIGNATKASSRVRAFWLAEEWKKNNHQVTVLWEIQPFIFWKLLSELWISDVFIFQKTYGRTHLIFAKMIRVLNKPYFVDIDDFPSRDHNEITLNNFQTLCIHSNGVFAGSETLKSWIFSFQPRVYLIPSGIKESLYISEEKNYNNHNTCLGWIGNGVHYQTDLIEILLPIAMHFSGNPNIEFRFIGVDETSLFAEKMRDIFPYNSLFIQPKDWADTASIVKEINKIDIGLYPLIENDFNKYKCGFKALEYFALKLPVVSSNIAMNREIINNGINGYLVNNNHEWIEKLTVLINQKNTRIQFGLEGFNLIHRTYNVSKIAKDLMDIFNEKQ